MNEQLIGDLFAEATRRMTGSSSKEFSQKFAELIVAECISVVNKTDPPGYADYPDYRDQIEQAFRSECATEIKKHFGVEE